MKTYYANFNANNGTFLKSALKSNNKRELLKTIREIANSNRTEGNDASFWIENTDGTCICDGRINKKGRTCYIINNSKPLVLTVTL